ncbi:S24 family peptidase [Palleronia caenipelagi]|uniref:Helix-turn-helix transcriptional regulator n=1 Tax=Palleronia caenipelagi TaxID=2489174 RepID=A0A547PW67_9RHOB|nr:S24 family peptidase [Palleronia caenipelagi]TRD18361.1 helix-turn-helix transcriptional regulator [Palleronia caenipelagi]
MMGIAEDFRSALEARLVALDLKPSAAEQRFGLKEGTIRNVLRLDAQKGLARRPRIDTVAEIIDALGLDFTIGPPRETTPPPDLAGDEPDFATVVRSDAQAEGGDGFINLDEAPVIDRLAFSRKWLSQNGINPARCVLIGVKGASMEPSIYEGDLIMIDRARREIRNGRIYGFNDPDKGTRLKRLEVIPGAAIVIKSDNPDQQKYPLEYATGERMNAISQGIVGQVVWSGHKWT